MPPEILIALVASIIPIINNGVAFITKVKEAQGGTEWTEEQRAAFKAELDKMETTPEEWQKQQPL